MRGGTERQTFSRNLFADSKRQRADAATGRTGEVGGSPIGPIVYTAFTIELDVNPASAAIADTVSEAWITNGPV